MAGKPEAFSAEENHALRKALRQLREEKELSQADVGRLLGIAQQNAGRLLGASSHTGMSRQTANRLANALGFRDAEHFLLDAGVLAEMRPIPSGHWTDRDVAARVARKMGYDETVIVAVLSRYTANDYRAKSMRWWNDRFVLEQMARAEEAPTASPPVPPPDSERLLANGDRRDPAPAPAPRRRVSRG